jgi:hypothetical protein
MGDDDCDDDDDDDDDDCCCCCCVSVIVVVVVVEDGLLRAGDVVAVVAQTYRHPQLTHPVQFIRFFLPRTMLCS